jgi:hypothetical protein
LSADDVLYVLDWRRLLVSCWTWKPRRL